MATTPRPEELARWGRRLAMGGAGVGTTGGVVELGALVLVLWLVQRLGREETVAEGRGRRRMLELLHHHHHHSRHHRERERQGYHWTPLRRGDTQEAERDRSARSTSTSW